MSVCGGCQQRTQDDSKDMTLVFLLQRVCLQRECSQRQTTQLFHLLDVTDLVCVQVERAELGILCENLETID
jgi:hypothetical protein